MNWKRKLLSRKFLIAVVAAVVLVLTEGMGIELDKETIMAFAAIVITWILGESYIDSKK